MKIKVTSEQELLNIACEGIHILSNLRKFTRLWEKEHGVEAKERKKYWEEKADEFVLRLQVPEHRNLSQIKIEIHEDKMEDDKRGG